MNSFERFKNKQRRRDTANEHYNAQFIFNAYNSVTITNGEEDIEASLVSKQEKDQGYIYTHYDVELPIGSVWEVKNLHWLIIEEIINIKDTDYHKYFALLCNVDLGDSIWGYFKSNLSIKNEQDTVLESLQEPRITLPGESLKFADKIVIYGRPWIVQEYDSISQPGITIYSLQSTTISKDETEERDSYIVKTHHEEPEIIDDVIDIGHDERAIGHEIPVTLDTEQGYVKCIGNVKILKRSGTSVTFSIPFGVDEIDIEVKQQGEVVSYHYFAVD